MQIGRKSKHYNVPLSKSRFAGHKNETAAGMETIMPKHKEASGLVSHLIAFTCSTMYGIAYIRADVATIN